MGSERPDRTTETAKIAFAATSCPHPPKKAETALRSSQNRTVETHPIHRAKRPRADAPHGQNKTPRTARTRRPNRPRRTLRNGRPRHKKRDGRLSLCGQSPVSMLRFPKEAGHYIIPMPFMPAPAAGIAGAGSFFSASTHSVVRNIEAIEAAFSRATRATLVGSRIPASSISS